MNIGGVSEKAATAFFAVLFLLFLSLGFLNIRRHRVDLHRQWMIRAFGIALGVATTRPIVGAFFAARRLSPHEFFGAAFWLGFTTTLVAAEAWIHYTEPRGLPSVATRPHRSAASLRPQRAAGASSDGRASLPSAEDIR